MNAAELGAVTVLLATFDELSPDAPDLAALVAVQLVIGLLHFGRVHEAVAVTRRALDLPVADPDVAFLVAHRHASMRVWQGETAALDELRRGFPLAEQSRRALAQYPMYEQMTGQMLMLCEQFTESRSAIACEIEVARRESALSRLPLALMMSADLDMLTGDVARAVAALEETLELADVGFGGLVGFTHAFRARAAATAGDVPTARHHIAMAETARAETGQRAIDAYRLHAAGLLELGQGRPTTAARVLDPLAEIVQEIGTTNAVGIPWRADHIEALAAAGRTGDARAALAELETAAERSASRWARSTARRCRALLGDPDADALLTEAAQEQHDLPFERGRTRLAHGALLRRERRVREARALLDAAATDLTRYGATPWATRARAELRAAGVRPTEPAAPRPTLTGQELRVCLAVAEGATNREVAAALYLSRKTVEYHLGKAFTKLGIANRTQLARIAADGGLTS